MKKMINSFAHIVTFEFKIPLSRVLVTRYVIYFLFSLHTSYTLSQRELCTYMSVYNVGLFICMRAMCAMQKTKKHMCMCVMTLGVQNIRENVCFAQLCILISNFKTKDNNFNATTAIMYVLYIFYLSANSNQSIPDSLMK